MSTTVNAETARATAHWSVDPTRTIVEFAVKSFWGAATVRGEFQRFEGSYEVTPAGRRAIQLTIDAGSLTTRHQKRDDHLLSSDFFHAEQHPTVRFDSSRIDDLGEGRLRVHGQLEAAGKAVPLEFDATVYEDGDALELEATTVVNPRDFGMSSGMLGMIRPSALLHVRAHVVPAQSLQAAA
jgi:polyisoprenoid-binding protein YceI